MSRRWVMETARIPLPDGEELHAEVVRPLEGVSPVLLMRSPYPLGDLRFQADPVAVTRRGLGLVMVSHRGTGESSGTFRPWLDDAADGWACLEWCAQQPWSTGRVVTHGRSYVAQTQLYAASTRHPALCAMSLEVCPSDPYDIIYTHGALRLGFAGNWAIQQSFLAMAREGQPVSGSPDPVAAMMERPTSDLGELQAHFPHWTDWVQHPRPDAWWQERALPDREPLPSLFLAGWHDVFLPDTIKEFHRSSHPESRLVIGPWDHGLPWRALGGVDYGPAGAGGSLGLEQDTLDFLAAHAFGTPAPVQARVRYFTTGTNEWHEADRWPVPSEPVTWCLDAATGALSEDVPAAAGEVSFLHDPEHPVPTVGGANLFDRGAPAGGSGSWDQAALDGRADLVRFDSEPLEASVEIVGTVEVALQVKADSPHCDWAVKLVDVHPDGGAFNITDGILRVTLPDHEAMQEVVVSLWPTAHAFLAGHRIRLEIAGSNHPRFDVNPGTGFSIVDHPQDVPMRPVSQTVCTGMGRASVVRFCTPVRARQTV